MLLWAGCQVFRIAALPYLGKQDTGQSRFVALAAMVFLDHQLTRTRSFHQVK